MDRVGFEPTTSASQHVLYFVVQSALMKRSFCSNPTQSMLSVDAVKAITAIALFFFL